MSDLNKVTLIGRLGKDPECRTFANGGKMASFSLATSDKYTNRAGEQVEETEWHYCDVLFPKLAEIVEKYVHKGDKIYIEGKIKTNRWQDQNGQDKELKKIQVSSVIMLGSKGGGQQNDGGQAQAHQQDNRQQNTGGGGAYGNYDKYNNVKKQEGVRQPAAWVTQNDQNSGGFDGPEDDLPF